ncbi:acyl-CoA thioesterase [Rhodobacteraceae bacterium LMO-12]|nr:acyl-CoA thioesterase [Rhodobacteraceae bacterium LMO-JJ12]
MSFVFTQKVKFRHCDAAGIVFYPRFFEMINDTIEEFFEVDLAYPFAAMHPAHGIPTAQIETKFKAPCRLGDVLQIHLECTRLGTTSMGLALRAECDGELRFSAQSTLVHINAKTGPEPWPNNVRDNIRVVVTEAAAS